jgi:hypothetical protein
MFKPVHAISIYTLIQSSYVITIPETDSDKEIVTACSLAEAMLCKVRFLTT